MKIKALLTILIFVEIINFKHSYGAANSIQLNNLEYTVYVYDATSRQPLHAVKVFLKKNGLIEGYQFTEGNGKAIFRNMEPGRYQLNAGTFDYANFSDSITISKEHYADSVGLIMAEKAVETDTVSVYSTTFEDIQPIQLTTGNQLLDARNYHTSPTAKISDIVQSGLLGAAKAPTGEIHIRGMHGEFTYYVDGIPIPLGVFGGLNEIVDTKVIDRMSIMTGGFPAEYGGQMAAAIDIQTIVPTGHLHADFSGYSGSYFVLNGARPFSPGKQVAVGSSGGSTGDTLGGKVGPFRAINSNGLSFSVSNHIGNFGFFVSGSRQETDRRVDTPTPVLFNDHGTDYFLYGKFDYVLSANDFLTMNLNYGVTQNQVPFDNLKQGYAPDNQSSNNSFQTLTWYHTISSKTNAEKNLFVGIFARQGGLTYTPSPISPASFQFAGDSTGYALFENRSFNTMGIRTKFEDRFSNYFKFDIGFNFNATTGKEDFSSRDSMGNPGPKVLSNFNGSDFGMFAQEEYQPFDWLRFDAGLRYDRHIAPDMAMQYLFQPRAKLNFFFDKQNTFFIYYGKLLIPANVEALRLLASNVDPTGQATLPEKDNFYEMDYLHLFSFGLTIKTALFHKFASPGMDDQTVGSSSVKTPVNIAEVHTTGLELGISYTHPTIPFSGLLNISVIHAYGSGNITGGFLPIASDGPATDLDHDQRLSISADLNYQPNPWFFNLSAIYGSGLTNGNPNDLSYKTGLFDFNTGTHVSPYVIFNLSLGYKFRTGRESTIEPSLYINNLLDNRYIMKRAYFSGASWGEPRNVVLKVDVHI